MYTEAQKRATQKYQKEHQEQLRIWVKKGSLQAVKDFAESKGTTMADYVKSLIKKDMEIEEL